MNIHVVKPGDTLLDIAGQYGVSPQRIVSDNAIADENRLVVGQALVMSFVEHFKVFWIEMLWDSPEE